MDKEKTAELRIATRSYYKQFFMELVSQRLDLMCQVVDCVKEDHV